MEQEGIFISRNTIVLAAAIIAVAIIAGAAYGHFTRPVEKPKCGLASALETAFYPPAPQLPQVRWLDGPSRGLSDFECKIIVVNFWSSGCSQCVNDSRLAEGIAAKYKRFGVEAINVHSGEFDFENDTVFVEMARGKFGITSPTALDDGYAFSRAFKSNVVPQVAIIDPAGLLRYNEPGAINPGKLEEALRNVIKSSNESVMDVPFNASSIDNWSAPRYTLDYYGGYEYAENPLGNIEGLYRNEKRDYIIPVRTLPGFMYVEGEWNATGDRLSYLGGRRGSLLANFAGAQVNIVAGAAGGVVKLNVTIDGQPLNETTIGADAYVEGNYSYVNITKPGMYSVAKLKRGVHMFIASTSDSGLDVFKIAFG